MKTKSYRSLQRPGVVSMTITIKSGNGVEKDYSVKPGVVEDGIKEYVLKTLCDNPQTYVVMRYGGELFCSCGDATHRHNPATDSDLAEGLGCKHLRALNAFRMI